MLRYSPYSCCYAINLPRVGQQCAQSTGMLQHMLPWPTISQCMQNNWSPRGRLSWARISGQLRQRKSLRSIPLLYSQCAPPPIHSEHTLSRHLFFFCCFFLDSFVFPLGLFVAVASWDLCVWGVHKYWAIHRGQCQDLNVIQLREIWVRVLCLLVRISVCNHGDRCFTTTASPGRDFKLHSLTPQRWTDLLTPVGQLLISSYKLFEIWFITGVRQVTFSLR